MASSETAPRRATGETGATAARPRRSGGLAFLREVGIVLLAALFITSLTRAFVMQPFVIPSGSMQNTLQGGDPRYPDDRVMAIKFGGFDRGDIVVFEDFGHWLTSEPAPATPGQRVLELVGLLPDSSRNYLVKRVIGMPGDRVECCGDTGQLLVNGKPLDERSYLYSGPDGQVKPSDFPFVVVVPQGRVFVMGDHRNASSDSRCHLREMGIDAFVPIDKVAGPVKAIILPQNRWRSFDPPEVFASVPAPAAPAPAEPVIEADRVGC